MSACIPHSMLVLYIGITKLRHSRLPERQKGAKFSAVGGPLKFQINIALSWNTWYFEEICSYRYVKTCIGNKLGWFTAICVIEKYDFGQLPFAKNIKIPWINHHQQSHVHIISKRGRLNLSFLLSVFRLRNIKFVLAVALDEITKGTRTGLIMSILSVNGFRQITGLFSDTTLIKSQSFPSGCQLQATCIYFFVGITKGAGYWGHLSRH